MIQKERARSRAEGRLLALMIAVALIGAVLPSLIRERQTLRGVGESTVSAESGNGTGDKPGEGISDKECHALPVAAVRQKVPLLREGVRALWIASAYGIDYPSEEGGCLAEMKAEINRIVQNAVDMGMSAVFFQVRPAADALYRSDIFPVSEVIGGELRCGFDPLDELCRAAHRAGISVVAWVNPLRVTLSVAETKEQALSALLQGSPAAAHPEYCCFPGGRLWFDPGFPEVRELVAAGVAEIVSGYPVDGVVFDDYFYPYPSTFEGWDDSESYGLYGGGADIGDYRRNNINELIRVCSEAVHEADGDCVFGVAPFGIWRNSSIDERGSDTRGFSAYDGIYADALAWVRNGSVDFLSPQIYFRRDDEAASASVLMQWWSDALGGSGVPLIYSLADYKASLWEDGREIAEQEQLAAALPGCIGCAHYGYGALCADDFGVRSCLSEGIG